MFKTRIQDVSIQLLNYFIIIGYFTNYRFYKTTFWDK